MKKQIKCNAREFEFQNAAGALYRVVFHPFCQDLPLESLTETYAKRQGPEGFELKASRDLVHYLECEVPEVPAPELIKAAPESLEEALARAERIRLEREALQKEVEGLSAEVLASIKLLVETGRTVEEVQRLIGLSVPVVKLAWQRIRLVQK